MPVLWLAPIALAFAWVSLSGYQGLNGQDPHDYYRLAKSWAAWLHGAGDRPAVVEHPHAYPFAGALIGSLVGDVLWGMRLLPLFSFGIVVVLIARQMHRRHPGAPAIMPYVLLLLGLSPFLMRYALVVMSDLPNIALITAAWVLASKAIDQRRTILLLLALAFGALAISVRYAAAPMLLAMLACVIARPGLDRKARVMLGAITVVAVMVAIVLVLPPSAEVTGSTHRQPLSDWSPMNLFRRELRSDDGALHYRVPNIIYVLAVAVHPGFIPIGALLIPFFRRSDLDGSHARLALWMVVGYLLFVAGMPFQNDRVLLMAQPLVAVLFFPAFSRAWAWLRARTAEAWLVVVALGVVQLALFARAMLPFMHQGEAERAVAAVINEEHPHRVYTHGMGAALTNYCPSIQITELWYAPLDHFDREALLLVQPANLDQQWTGLPPEINWRRAMEQGMDPILTRNDGWVLYRVR